MDETTLQWEERVIFPHPSFPRKGSKILQGFEGVAHKLHASCCEATTRLHVLGAEKLGSTSPAQYITQPTWACIEGKVICAGRSNLLPHTAREKQWLNCIRVSVLIQVCYFSSLRLSDNSDLALSKLEIVTRTILKTGSFYEHKPETHHDGTWQDPWYGITRLLKKFPYEMVWSAGVSRNFFFSVFDYCAFTFSSLRIWQTLMLKLITAFFSLSDMLDIL